MKNILRKFLQSLDWSKLPIGPQAELIEQLKELNRIVPTQMQSNEQHREHWKTKGFPEISFEITKRFTWGRNTTHKIKDCIDHYQNLFPYKGYTHNGIHSIFDKREKSRSYMYLNFKNAVTKLDRVLAEKRWSNEIWIDDDKKVKGMVKDIQDKIISSFQVFSDYMEADSAYPNKKMKYFISDSLKVEDNRQLLTDIVKMLWKDDNYPAVVFLDDGIGKTQRGNSVKPSITVLCQFPNLIMNTFRGDSGKVPVFRSPVGKVVTAFQLDFEQMVRFALGYVRYNQYTRHFIQKFWHKPSELGIKHPYINGFMRRSHQVSTPINEWPITFAANANTCFGNIDVHKHVKKLNLVLWAEEVHTWLTTFRIGTTYPLNNLSQTYWGHPEETDSNLDNYYLDTIGHNSLRCNDRMRNYYNAVERKDMCHKHCSKIHRQECDGYKDDQINFDRSVVDLIFNEVLRPDLDHYDESIRLFIADSTFPLINMYSDDWDDYNERYYYTIPALPNDTIPYLLPDLENSLEDDMKSWMINNERRS